MTTKLIIPGTTWVTMQRILTAWPQLPQAAILTSVTTSVFSETPNKYQLSEIRK